MTEKPLFGKFEIIKCFKKDESLAVYLADHIYLNKKIILKTLNTGTIADQVVLERFKREAQLLAKIDHPNIISVYDFGTFEEFFYISFEYFESKNLRQAFKNNSWNIEDKINILNQIATGLSETHRKKIIHRDLKPENILINDNVEVKIADFGLAQVSGGEKLTAVEAVVGTPAYMTPEQIHGLNTDERSDLFSFGILIYEMFFGVNPFLGKDAGQTLNNIQTCRINTPPPHSGMPEYIPIIIDTLLKKNQTDRPKSVDFIFNFTGKELTGPPTSSNKKSKYVLPAIAVVLIGIVFVLQNVFYSQNQQSSEKEILQDTTTSSIELGQDSINVSLQEKENVNATPKKNTVLDKDIFKPDTTVISDSVALLTQQKFGFIDVKCKPWAEVFIDSIKIDTTPLKELYRLTSGEHVLQLKHPQYPDYRSILNIPENDTLLISVNLDTLVGFFTCNVFPWGDIYINEDFKGQTPLNKPIILKPGKHVLEVKNPGYKIYKSEISITKSDTLKKTLKLVSLTNSN